MTDIKIHKIKLWSFAIAVAGTIIALLLMPFSKDYANYSDTFDTAAHSGSFLNSISGIELTYSTLAYTTKNIFITSAIMGVIALTIKVNFFSKYKEVFFIASAYYFARFFGVHDITQLRIAFAIAMLILAFNRLLEYKYLKGSLFLLLAVVSHNSTLIYVPIILFAALVKQPRTTLKKSFIIITCVVPLVLLAAFQILKNIPIETIIDNLPDARLSTYYSEEYDFVVPSMLTDAFLYIKTASLLALIFLPPLDKDDDAKNSYEARCGIVFLFSLTFFVAFHPVFAIATRLADIAAPFECVVVALFIIRLSRPNKVFFSPYTSFFLRAALSTIIVIRLLIAQAYLFQK